MGNLVKNICRELMVEIDHMGKIITVSDNCCHILGYNSAEMINSNIRDFIIGNGINLFEENKNNLRLHLINKKKEYKYFDVLIYLLKDDTNKVTGATLSLINISGFSKKKETNLLQILEVSKDIIYMLELESQLKLLYINKAVTEKLGISIEESYENPNIIFEKVHPEDKDKFNIKIKNQMDYSKTIQIRYQHTDGEYIWFEESLVPIYKKDKLIVLIGFCRDIQEQKEREAKLKELSFYDSLTGIYNRTYFEKELNYLDSQINQPTGMIVCDLDNLKYINDNFGHIQGDELLKQFANVIERYTSKNIICARVGGDEFVILIKGKSNEFVEDLYSDLLKSIRAYNLASTSLPIKVSIGLGYSKISIGMTEWVYKIADSRMYKNKAINKKYNKDIGNQLLRATVYNTASNIIQEWQQQ